MKKFFIKFKKAKEMKIDERNIREDSIKNKRITLQAIIIIFSAVLFVFVKSHYKIGIIFLIILLIVLSVIILPKICGEDCPRFKERRTATSCEYYVCEKGHMLVEGRTTR